MSKMGDSVIKGRPLLLVMAGCILPWCIVLIACSGLIALTNFLGLLLILTGLGYVVLMGVVGDLCVGDRMLISPATGYIVASGTLAIATKLGCSPGLTFWVISIAGLLGAILYGRASRSVLRTEVDLGVAYVGLSTLVCLIYFLPGALRDAVLLKDGAFNWVYVDTQYHMAVAAAIKTSLSSPKMPGLGIADFDYHFGPYAISGALSAATGIELADAYARVVRGAAQFILLASTVGMSRILSRQAGGVNFAGLLGALGLFFYGSIGSLFENYQNSSSFVSGPILFKIPRDYYISVIDQGGPFSHLVLGHSVMNSMIGITVVVALLLSKVEARTTWRMGPDVSCLLPGLVATIHAIAGLGVFGVYAGTLLILGRRNLRVIAACFLASVGFIVVIKVMGYVGSSSAGQMELNKGAMGMLFQVFVWFFVGLGIRIFALRWIKNIGGSAAWLILLLFILGFGAYSIGITDNFDAHNRYGFKFLQAILSIFAFVALAKPIDAYLNGRKKEVDVFWNELMGILFWSGTFFLMVSLIGYAIEGTRGHPNYDTLVILKRTLISSLAIVASSWLIRKWMRQNLKIMTFVKIVVLVIYMVGSLAWITSWLNFGVGRMKMDIVVSKGEVDGLRQVRDISVVSDLIATNRHMIESLPVRSEPVKQYRSYSYGTLLERRILLEGWAYGEQYHPLFSKVQRDNDALFNTRDPDEARSIAKRYHINYIVAQPGTDVLFAERAHAWLRSLPDTGTIKVYEVLDSSI